MELNFTISTKKEIIFVKSYKQLAVSLSMLPLLISGCASTSKNIQIIEKKKQNRIKTKIKISNETGYKVYLDSDNNLKYICTSDNNIKDMKIFQDEEKFKKL